MGALQLSIQLNHSFGVLPHLTKETGEFPEARKAQLGLVSEPCGFGNDPSLTGHSSSQEPTPGCCQCWVSLPSSHRVTLSQQSPRGPQSPRARLRGSRTQPWEGAQKPRAKHSDRGWGHSKRRHRAPISARRWGSAARGCPRSAPGQEGPARGCSVAPLCRALAQPTPQAREAALGPQGSPKTPLTAAKGPAAGATPACGTGTREVALAELRVAGVSQQAR